MRLPCLDKFLDLFAEKLAAKLPRPSIHVPHEKESVAGQTHLQRIISSLEWEILARGMKNLNITRINDETGNLGTLTLQRGPSYEILATMSTDIDLNSFDERGDKNLGEFYDGHTVHGILDEDESVIVLNHVHFGAVHHTFDRAASRRTSAQIETFRVERIWRRQEDASPSFVQDWFIGGPHSLSGPFLRASVREFHERFVRKRPGPRNGPLDASPVEFPPSNADSALNVTHSRDYCVVTPSDDLRFIVARVPDGFGPTWSKSVCIEYREELGGIPSEEQRIAFSEIVSFLLGRHMLQVGSTSYDKVSQPIKATSNPPWGRDAVENCTSQDRQPIPLDGHGNRPPELDISKLTKEYMEYRDLLNLSDAIWITWLAQRMPLGYDLPLYSAALESLMQSWFKSKESKTKGIYMEKKKFDSLVGEFIEAASEKLKGHEHADRMIRKMGNSFQMSVNEKFPAFFSEIGLAIGNGEDAVIRARNSTAHGHSLKKEDYQKFSLLGGGYKTLINRTLLKILGFDGFYIDYSSLNWPQRNIDEPIGLDKKYQTKKYR